MSSFYGNSGVDKNTLSQIAENTNNIGNLLELNTTAKDNLVAAINQAAAEATAVQEAIAAAENATEAANIAENAVNNITQNLVQISENTNSITEIKNYLDMKINTKEVSGSFLNFSDGLEGYPFKKLEVELEPIQNLNGQANPYPGGGSANILPDVWEDGTFDQTTGEKISGSSLKRTVNQILVIPETEYFRYKDVAAATIRIFYYDANMSLISSAASSVNDYTFTTPANCYFINLAVQTSANLVGINYPSTITTYVPYSNICPISGRTEVNVWGTGKNLAHVAAENESFKGNGNYFTLSYNANSVTMTPTLIGSLYVVYGAFEATEALVGTTFVFSGTTTGGLIGLVRSDVVGTWSSGSSTRSNVYTIAQTDIGHLFGVRFTNTTGTAQTASNLQLEVGSTATTYEPYNGQSVTVEFPALGKNLFNPEAAEANKWLNVNTGAAESTFSNYALSDWIPVKANTAYTFTRPNSARRWFYDVSKNPVQKIDSLTYTPSSNGFIRITIGLSDTSLDSMMFVEGTTLPSTYKPYTNTVYGGNVNMTTGKITVNRAMLTFDGTENWLMGAVSYIKSDSTDIYLVQNNMQRMQFNETPTKGKCNQLAASTTTIWAVTGHANQFVFNATQSEETMFTARDKVKAWLAAQYANGTPVTITYPLATPLTIQLSSQQLTTLKGTNNVWSNGDNINATYVTNIESRLDNKQGASEIICNASGSIASFSDGADGYAIKNLTVNIQPIQDLHGQDASYPAGGGKNLWPVKDMTFSGYSNRLTEENYPEVWAQIRKLKAGATYRISSTSTGDNTWGTLIIYYGDSTNTAIRPTNMTGVAIPDFSDESVVITSIYVQIGGNTTGERTATDCCLMETATSNPAYVPYSNICPISGRTEVNVWGSGKNLFPIEISIDDSIYPHNIYVENYPDLSDFFAKLNTLRGQTVCYSCATTGTASGVSIGVLRIYKSATLMQTFNPSVPMTVADIDFSEATMIVIYGSTNGATIKNIQFEIGTSATAYEPYQPIQTVNMQLGQTVYGGTVDITSGEMTIGWQKYVGSAFTTASTRTGGYYARMLLGGLSYEGGPHNPVLYACNMAKRGQDLYDTWYYNPAGSIGTATSYVHMYVPEDAIDYHEGDNVANLLNATYNASDFEFILPLVEPLAIQLVGQSLSTLKGTNNIWSDAGDVSVDYVADTKLYISQLTEPDPDMIADANIVSGKYFMVGNNLYKATVNIAKDAAIVPGMNCTKTNLAAALNEINS